MCGNVGDWVMMQGQTPHHRLPDTHSSLGEITGSMLATLHIHLPPWANMKALHISTLAKIQQCSNKKSDIKMWLFRLKICLVSLYQNKNTLQAECVGYSICKCILNICWEIQIHFTVNLLRIRITLLIQYEWEIRLFAVLPPCFVTNPLYAVRCIKVALTFKQL